MELSLKANGIITMLLQEFLQKIPDFNYIVADFYNVVRNTVRLCGETINVHHKKGAGRPTLCTNEVIENEERWKIIHQLLLTIVARSWTSHGCML